jgi:hypothetical protein
VGRAGVHVPHARDRDAKRQDAGDQDDPVVRYSMEWYHWVVFVFYFVVSVVEVDTVVVVVIVVVVVVVVVAVGPRPMPNDDRHVAQPLQSYCCCCCCYRVVHPPSPPTGVDP